ncbi:hypothetical protein [Arthrobacter sp. SX1312]|uniref:hypothetical protein n=1 Tax=Arthrobacter sp. SX1312 TaxID=2058896 RepID=UPI0011B067D6|nr:hypothetical protein [Arthrobacter sp. SX1312]
MEAIESMLTGGHPNSMGRTVEVVELVVADRSRLEELFGCYGSTDPVVRLRTSSALKRLEAARHEWLVPFADRLIDDVGMLDQPSAQWTLAKLLLRLTPDLTPDQRRRATVILQRNLEQQHDWIVLINTMETLSAWSAGDPALRAWLDPQLERLAGDPRTSVAERARNLTARARGDRMPSGAPSPDGALRVAVSASRRGPR